MIMKTKPIKNTEQMLRRGQIRKLLGGRQREQFARGAKGATLQIARGAKK